MIRHAQLFQRCEVNQGDVWIRGLQITKRGCWNELMLCAEVCSGFTFALRESAKPFACCRASEDKQS